MREKALFFMRELLSKTKARKVPWRSPDTGQKDFFGVELGNQYFVIQKESDRRFFIILGTQAEPIFHEEITAADTPFREAEELFALARYQALGLDEALNEAESALAAL